MGAFDYVDFQFKLPQIPVIARYEAIHSHRHCEVRSNPGCPALDCFTLRARNDEATS
ncbi:MAG: hypothetical protein LBS88_08320 [Tannerellaceae bacterium]|nr:hypothetical protein [Tannerellaceae bacterium]